MERIIDLLKRCDKEKAALHFSDMFVEKADLPIIKNQYVEYKSYSDKEILELYKEKMSKSFNKALSSMLELTPILSDHICAIVKYKEDTEGNANDDFYDVFTFRLNDFKEKYKLDIFKTCHTYEDIKESPYLFDTYTFMYEDWKKVLGYMICDHSLDTTNNDEAAALIIHEMTWSGFDYETAEKNRKKFFNQIAESEKQIENGETVSLDECFDELEKDCNIDARSHNSPYVFSDDEVKAMIYNKNHEFKFYKSFYENEYQKIKEA